MTDCDVSAHAGVTFTDTPGMSLPASVGSYVDGVMKSGGVGGGFDGGYGGASGGYGGGQ